MKKKKSLVYSMKHEFPPLVFIGADHAGFLFKENIKKTLLAKGWPVSDKGAGTLQPTDDYPDYAEAVAREVVAKKGFGILVCGSGLGMCIAANKIKGTRAVAPVSIATTKLSRLDNNANILCLSGRNNQLKQALRIITTFFTTPFSNEERHKRRIEKISKMEV